jgi:hypothetical protein
METEISVLLKEFTDRIELDPSHLIIKEADISADARRIVNDVGKLERPIESIETAEFYGETDMWNHLLNLSEVIRNKLRELGWRI